MSQFGAKIVEIEGRYLRQQFQFPRSADCFKQPASDGEWVITEYGLEVARQIIQSPKLKEA